MEPRTPRMVFFAVGAREIFDREAPAREPRLAVLRAPD